MANKKVYKFDSRILSAILYLVIGILFCVFRSGSLQILLTVIGILSIVYGVVDLIKRFYYTGIFGIALGVILLVGGAWFASIAILIFGVFLAVKGIVSLIEVFKMAKPNLFAIIGAAITVLIGVLLIVNKWVMLDWFFILIGIVFIVDGILILIGK